MSTAGLAAPLSPWAAVVSRAELTAQGAVALDQNRTRARFGLGCTGAPALFHRFEVVFIPTAASVGEPHALPIDRVVEEAGDGCVTRSWVCRKAANTWVAASTFTVLKGLKIVFIPSTAAIDESQALSNPWVEVPAPKQGKARAFVRRKMAKICMAVGRCKWQLSWELLNPTKKEEKAEAREEEEEGGEAPRRRHAASRSKLSLSPLSFLNQ